MQQNYWRKTNYSALLVKVLSLNNTFEYCIVLQMVELEHIEHENVTEPWDVILSSTCPVVLLGTKI
jgi:hypothetical protein